LEVLAQLLSLLVGCEPLWRRRFDEWTGVVEVGAAPDLEQPHVDGRRVQEREDECLVRPHDEDVFLRVSALVMPEGDDRISENASG
jgi:hypothetical protein